LHRTIPLCGLNGEQTSVALILQRSLMSFVLWLASIPRKLLIALTLIIVMRHRTSKLESVTKLGCLMIARLHSQPAVTHEEGATAITLGARGFALAASSFLNGSRKMVHTPNTAGMVVVLFDYE